MYKYFDLDDISGYFRKFIFVNWKALLLKIVGCIDYGRLLYLNLYVLSSEDILLVNPN